MPAERRVADVDQEARPEMSPDNIAPVALYLASERSDWLTGRVVSAMGFHVGLYENPQEVRRLSSPGPWPYDMLADAIEQSFRPVANGLPPSIFHGQAAQ